MSLILLVYGMAFIVLAVALLVIPRRQGVFLLARQSGLLAAFAGVHAASELVEIDGLLGAHAPWRPALHAALVLVSFALLAQFGVTALVRSHRKLAWTRAVPPLVAVAICLAGWRSTSAAATVELLARALLCAPGSALAAVALLEESRIVRDAGARTAARILAVAACGLVVYGVLAGLCVPRTASFGFLLDQAWFVRWLGLPIQVLRSTCALLLAGSVVRLTHALAEHQVDLVAELRRAKTSLAHEVEERHRAEEIARTSDRLATVGRLAAGVAHEINNPLAFVKANLGYLQKELEPAAVQDDGEVRELLAETLEGVDRIERIVSDLRTFARRDEGGVAPCGVAEVLEESVRLAGPRLRTVAEVGIDVAPGVPEVLVARHRLVQVFVNLLVNAGDAIEAANGHGQIRIRARAGREGVSVLVHDSGPGVPEQMRSRLFEPFFTTKPVGQGTGLGLALSREYVASFGGDLRLASSSGEGATFELLLPIAEVLQLRCG